MVTVPAYGPAAWLAAGATVAPTKTYSCPPPLNEAREAAPDGVKLVQPADGSVSESQQPVQVLIGRLLPPLVRTAGSANEIFTLVEACPAASNRPEVAASGAMTLFSPGVTFPKSSARKPLT